MSILKLTKTIVLMQNTRLLPDRVSPTGRQARLFERARLLVLPIHPWIHIITFPLVML
jgi:hypothetical protein